MPPDPWPNQLEEAAMIEARSASFIAADMGTGKSAAAILGLRNSQRVLIVCPIAVGAAWVKQLGIWDPSREPVLIVEGASKKRAEALAGLGARVAVICNYDSVWRGDLGKAVGKISWDAILLDESHRIKSPSGKSSRWLAKLAESQPSAKRVCLTGTPTPHGPLDWWAQFRFLDQSILGKSYTAYRSRIAVTHPRYPGFILNYRAEALEALSRRIDPHVYRISIDDVISLPEIIHADIAVTLPPKARKIYDNLERDMVAVLEESGNTITAANKLSLVTRLQQITSGFCAEESLYGEDELSPKERALQDWLEDLPKDEPLVVFCKFRRDLDSCAKVLATAGRSCSELSGRIKQLEAWQRGETNALVVQQQAGGVGVDLTRCCMAVYYSLSHSLGDFEQSLARLRRPGQNRPSRFVHLVVEDSVDRAIYEALQEKRDVVEEVLSRLQRRVFHVASS
jgi:SNF2 family DNA or RNA helicase